MGVLICAISWKLVYEKFISTMVVGFFNSPTAIVITYIHNMETLGYISYGILCLISLYYILGIRLKSDANIFTIFSSLFLTTFAILIPILGMSYLNSLWVIPAGIILTFLLAQFFISLGAIGNLIKILTSLYASILRIGILSKEINPFLENTKKEMRKEVAEMTGEDISHLEEEEIRERYLFGKEEEERIKAIRDKIDSGDGRIDPSDIEKYFRKEEVNLELRELEFGTELDKEQPKFKYIKK
jgi:hypothetical protein